MSKRWSKEELEYLNKNFSDIGATSCAIYLGRSLNSINVKASRLKLPSPSTWKAEEIIFLKEKYPTLGPKGCAEHMNKKYDNIKAKAHSMGLKYLNYYWTEEDIQFLESYYESFGAEYCSNELGKSLSAITTKAHLLKLNNTDSNRWIKEEETILEEEFTNGTNISEIALVLNKTQDAIRSKLVRMNLVTTTPRKSFDHLSNNDILELVRKYKTSSEFTDRKNLPSIRSILKRFKVDSWHKILELAGLPPNSFSRYNYDNTAIFYILEFIDSDGTKFKKFGVTQRTIAGRFKGRSDYTIIFYTETSLKDALSMESDIATKVVQYFPKDIRFTKRGHSGYTECFTEFIKEPEWLLMLDKREK